MTSSFEITEGQICGVRNGVGGPVSADVTDVSVSCIPNKKTDRYALGGIMSSVSLAMEQVVMVELLRL